MHNRNIAGGQVRIACYVTLKRGPYNRLQINWGHARSRFVRWTKRVRTSDACGRS